MDLETYRQQKEKFLLDRPKYRELCSNCVQPRFSCYCHSIQRFDAKIDFVILIHPIEVRRRIATGRMSYLSLENSHLIAGHNYSGHEEVNQLLADPDRDCLMLYPGTDSKNLSEMTVSQRKEEFKTYNRKLTIFVVDGTWATAKKMVKYSENLKKLPRICFSPEKPSNFRVRKQPHQNCYSTIEAIHQTIELLGESQGFNVQSREHDKLLKVFDTMVERQLEFIRITNESGISRYRREKRKRDNQNSDQQPA